MRITELASRFGKTRRVSDGFMALCPVHGDKNPSLHVSENDGKVLLHCHAGCLTESIVDALGIKLADLFTDSPTDSPDRRIVTTYSYTDESGKTLFEVVRYEAKDFRQRRPDGNGGWIWNLNGTRRVLYRLPEVIKAKSVIVAEGEKDVEAARKLGLTATCNPHGAGKWRPEYTEAFRGKRVAIIADADAPGRAHGHEVARSLVGVAEAVRLIEALPEAKDLSEWIERGGTRGALLDIIRGTLEVTAAELAKRQPVSAGGFTLMPLSELLAKPDMPVDYVLNGCLVAGTVSGVFAKPKVGKGTLARNLCLAVSRGEDFLSLSTKQGECIYLALEEREEDIKRDFSAMGANGSEPIVIHAAAAPPEGMRELCKLVRERKPRLVVIDPIVRLARIKDEKAYAETYNALGPLIDAARETGTHVMFLHHSPKSPKADAIDSPLGSTGYGAIVSTLIALKRTEAYRTIQTVQRIGQDLPETVLQFDPDTKRLSVGGTREEAETETLSGAILEFLEAGGEPKTEPEITQAVEGKTRFVRRALRQLVEQGGVLREGAGKRGDPYRYRFSFSCSQHIAGTREQEKQKPADTRINTERNLVPASEQESFLVPEDRESSKRVISGPENHPGLRVESNSDALEV